MKAIYVLILVIFSFNCFSQNGYEMKEGEIIEVDVYGKILNTNMPNVVTSKISLDLPARNNSDKNSIFNDDGTFKIPGYNPTGVQDVDEQNYKKAKHLFYQNSPAEYEKLFGKKPNYGKIKVSKEEFDKMPEIKKNKILSQPEKYSIEDIQKINDCK